MRGAKEINDLFKTLRYRIYANRTNDGTPEGCEQAMDDSIRIEQIADDFAKEVLRVYIGNKTLQYKQSQGEYSLDELLLIIKKEKGL